MNYNATEKAGQRKLSILLAVTLVIMALPAVLPVFGGLPAVLLFYQLPPLLPMAVLLWGLWRGSRPALVLFVISTVMQLGDVIGIFQYGGADALTRESALSLILLLLKLTTVLLIFRYDEVADYWSARMARRGNVDLILEIIFFVLALVLGALPLLMLSGLLQTN